MNWKIHVEKLSAKNYVLPEGWDSREKVAEDLECSPERVRVALAPGIKSGEVEMSVFPVWDTIVKRIVRTTAYRRKPEKPANKRVKKQ